MGEVLRFCKCLYLSNNVLDRFAGERKVSVSAIACLLESFSRRGV